MWALFDVLFGQSHETVGTCLLRLARDMPFPGWLVDAIDAMQKSRMGFYVHEGFEDRFVRLREIDREDVKLCHTTSGYRGWEGHIWIGRLVPPMNSLVKYHVFFTTGRRRTTGTNIFFAPIVTIEVTPCSSRVFPTTLKVFPMAV